jgi:hypothetical protein
LRLFATLGDGSGLDEGDMIAGIGDKAKSIVADRVRRLARPAMPA